MRRATILFPVEPGTLQKRASTQTSCPSPIYGNPFRESPSKRVCPSGKIWAMPLARWCRGTVLLSTDTLISPNPRCVRPVIRMGPPRTQPRVSSTIATPVPLEPKGYLSITYPEATRPLPSAKIATGRGMPGMLRAATGVACSSAPTVSLHAGAIAPSSAVPPGSACAGPPPTCQYARSCQTTMNAQPACAAGAVAPPPARAASSATTTTRRLMPLRRPGTAASSVGPVERSVHGPPHLRRQPRDGLEVVPTRADQRVGRAEALHQQAPPRRADAREAVEDGVHGGPATAGGGETQGGPVGLVARPLEQLEA